MTQQSIELPCSHTQVYPGTNKTVAEMRKVLGKQDAPKHQPTSTAKGCHYCGNPNASCSNWEDYLDCVNC